MNPIHESGFASLILLFLGFSLDFAFGVLALLLGAFRKKKGALGVLWVAALICALLMLGAAFMTSSLHNRIDYWINSGAYGPPDKIAAEYGGMWHDSADFTSIAGVVGGSLMIALLAPAFRLARGSWAWDMDYAFPIGVLALSWLICFVSAL